MYVIYSEAFDEYVCYHDEPEYNVAGAREGEEVQHSSYPHASMRFYTEEEAQDFVGLLALMSGQDETDYQYTVIYTSGV